MAIDEWDDPVAAGGCLSSLPQERVVAGYAWQVSLDPREVFVRTHTVSYQVQLSGIDGFELVPQDRLRIVLQEFGPASRSQVKLIVDALALSVMDVEPFELLFYRPEVAETQVRWEPGPPSRLVGLRGLAREAVAGVLGAVPGRADGFVPRMVIATGDGRVPDEQIAQRLAAATTRQVMVRFMVERLDLVARCEDGTLIRRAQAVLGG